MLLQQAAPQRGGLWSVRHSKIQSSTLPELFHMLVAFILHAVEEGGVERDHQTTHNDTGAYKSGQFVSFATVLFHTLGCHYIRQ